MEDVSPADLKVIGEGAFDELKQAFAEHQLAVKELCIKESLLQSRIESTIAVFKLAAPEPHVQDFDALGNLHCQDNTASPHLEFKCEAFDVDSEIQGANEQSNDTGVVRFEVPARPVTEVAQLARSLSEAEFVAKRAERDIIEHAVMDGSLAADPEECLPEEDLTTLQKIVSSNTFEAVSSFAIVFNTVTLAVSMEYAVKNYYKPQPTFFNVCETTFLVFYIVEAALRMAAWGKVFFTGLDKEYHMFDLFMIICALPDRAIALSGATSQLNLSFMRIIRITKLLKLGRVGRLMKRSTRIRLLLSMCKEGLGEALPLICFILSVVTMFSLVILSLVGSFLQEEWQNISPDLRRALLQNWGSLKDVMHSCFMSATGGLEWDALASSLREVGTFAYLIFLVFIVFYGLVCTNIVTCILIHLMMVCAENIDKFKVHVQLERTRRFVDVFTHLLGVTELSYHEFYEQMTSNEHVEHFLRNVMGTATNDADFLFYTLSVSGTEPVAIETFILGCIELKSPMLKMDLMQLKNHIDTELEEHAQKHRDFHQKILTHSATQSLAASIASVSSPLSEQKRHLQIRFVNEATLLQHLHAITCKIPSSEKQSQFSKACSRLVDMVRHAQGGCGFLLTTHKGFASMKRLLIDFQVVDRGSRYPYGYMTELLRNRLENNLHAQEFMDAIIQFTSHADTDRWPAGHEASGLPKDGFTIMTMSGKVLKAASRIVGLPTPPFGWDGVGTRHLAAMAVSWALRLHPSLVIVRSDTGRIHFLLADGNHVTALQLVADGLESDPWTSISTSKLKGESSTKAPEAIIRQL